MLLALLAGLTYGLSFPPYGVAPLAWLSVGCLVLGVRAVGSWRGALGVGVVAGATACALGYHWIAQTAHDFGMVPWVVAIGAWFIFALIGELNWTLFVLAAWWLRRPLSRLPAAWTAALFTLLEFVTPKVFPDVLAHSHIDVPFLASASALVGQFGVGFAMAWVSVAVAVAWQARAAARPRQRFARLEVALAIVVALGLMLYGTQRQRASLEIERSLDVLLLQTNIGDPIGLVNDSDHLEVVDSLVTLYDGWTRAALEDSLGQLRSIDLIVWPETAVPAGPTHGVYYRIQRLAIEADTPVVFGGYDFQRDEDGIWRIYNTLYWVDTEGALRDRYYKNTLIPIGEAIPFEEQFPQLRSLLPNAGEFRPGPGPSMMRVDGISMAPLICYELIFPRYVQQSLQKGGEVLLNVSNDYWFGRSSEPLQHLSLARMRAYETGRPIIRCTNTGITALVDAKGRLTHQTGIWKRQALRGTIDIPRMQWTPYARWGDRTTGLFVLLGCLVVGGLSRLRPFRSS